MQNKIEIQTEENELCANNSAFKGLCVSISEHTYVI